MKHHILIATLVVCLGLTACSGNKTSAGELDESIDKNQATAQCGILGGLFSGDVSITVDNVEEVTDTLELLAEDGVGEVKHTAAYMLATINGEHTSMDDEEAMERFKKFCLNYTVD